MPRRAGSPSAGASGDWGTGDIGTLTGSTALVTGANSGVGFETALALSRAGARVVLGCRDPERGVAAADRIQAAVPDAWTDVVTVDLASQASVAAAGDQLHQTLDRLDLLVNNAGVMAVPFGLTTDGFEVQFATNHLGPFALTGSVLDLLVTTGGSRVVTVSSVMHRMGHLSLADGQTLQGIGGSHNRWIAYANTKLANLLFTAELERRLRAAGAPTIAVAAHPGWARTRLIASGPGKGSRVRALGARVAGRLGQSAPEGALPILYAATASGVTGGEYFGPGGPGEQYGPPAPATSSRRAADPNDAARLWALSEELTGVRYDLLSSPGAPVNSPQGDGGPRRPGTHPAGRIG